MLLLVKISPRISRKVAIPEVPESVEELKKILAEKLELQGSFTLQYEDSDFNNALCNLINIHDLPPERAILHILWDETSPLVHQESDSVGSESSLDTASLSSRESLQSPSAFIRNRLRSVSEWPSPFPIPSFSYDVELKLRKGNEAYEQTKKGITLTRDMKMDILDKIAQAVFEVKAYPDQDQIESVGSALISRHPCLREPGRETGYDGWKTSIKYKLGNYRSKLRQAGCTEVSFNQKKRGSEEDGTSPSLKRAKRGEINHVPDHPENYSDDSLEDERLVLVEEFKKKNKNAPLIRQKMELTFSLRRREIVELQPMVSEVLERWPALFCEAEIIEEFYRITNKNLMDNFKEALHQHTWRLLRLYRARRTAFSSEMDQILNSLDQETSDITAHRQTAALKGLPLYLRDSQEKFFRNCLDTDQEKDQTKGLTVGILTVLEDDDSRAPQSVVSFAVVVEEEIVLQDLPDLPTAFAYLFGLIYALNLKYPKDLSLCRTAKMPKPVFKRKEVTLTSVTADSKLLVQLSVTPVIGTIQIMVGVFNIGLGPGRTSISPGDLSSLGAAYWLGAVFIVTGIMSILAAEIPSTCLVGFTVFMNIVGAIFSVTGIALYAIDLINSSVLWICDRSENNADCQVGDCRNAALFTQHLLMSVDVTMIALTVIQLIVSVRFAVVGIKALIGVTTEKQVGRDVQQPRLENTTWISATV